MNIEFVATVAVITADPVRSRTLYVEGLGLPLVGEVGGYVHSEEVPGCKSFGIWPLSEAAQACFGTDGWPVGRPIPQVSVEFDVSSADDVAPAAAELIEAGHDLLHEARTEPWGQTVARLQSPEGAIIGVAYTPVLHD